jgi:hypothetical protein
MERSVWSYNEEFVCRYFFDADTGVNGIDVIRKESGEHIGEMFGTELPDEEDGESIENFEKEVKNWLEENHW